MTRNRASAAVMRPVAGEKLIVDLFAGGGGMSEAFKMALGRDPDSAINHNDDALSMHRVNRISRQHLQETGTEPCVAVLVAKTGLPERKVRTALGAPCVVASLDETIPVESDAFSPWDDAPPAMEPLVETLPADPLNNPFIVMGGRVPRQMLDAAIAGLRKEQRLVLRMRFDLDGDGSGEQTLDAIGRILGVTRERVRQIESKALRILRSRLSAPTGRHVADAFCPVDLSGSPVPGMVRVG